MRRPLRSLLVWFALQLLLAQQLALAHRIGHLAERLSETTIAAAPSAAEHGEGEGAAHLHAHVCTACIAGFGLDGGAIATAPEASPGGRSPVPDSSAVFPAPTLCALLAFRSRAPPLSKD